MSEWVLNIPYTAWSPVPQNYKVFKLSMRKAVRESNGFKAAILF